MGSSVRTLRPHGSRPIRRIVPEPLHRLHVAAEFSGCLPSANEGRISSIRWKDSMTRGWGGEMSERAPRRSDTGAVSGHSHVTRENLLIVLAACDDRSDLRL